MFKKYIPTILLSLFSDMLFFFKKPYLFILWILFLPVISFVIILQILLTLSWFIVYCIIFLRKFILFKQNTNNVEPIYYRGSFNYNNNIILIFFINLLIDLPKKQAFFYFYTIIYFFLKKNNKKFFQALLKAFLKSPFNILKVFLNIIINIVIRILTSYPVFVIKTTNYLIKLMFNFNSLNRSKFKDFYSNVILNILSSYSFKWDDAVKNKKIKFEGNKIYTNPKSPISPSFIPNKFNDLGAINSFIRTICEHGELSYCSYNTSKSFISLRTPLKDDRSINTIELNESNILNDSPTILESGKKIVTTDYSPTIRKIEFENEEYISLKGSEKSISLRNSEDLEKLNKQMKYKYSGYKDESFSDFIKYDESGKGEEIIHESNLKLKEDVISNINSESNITIAAHIVPSEMQFLKDADNIIKDPASIMAVKIKLAKTFLYCYNKPLCNYNFIDGQNKFVFPDDGITLRDFCLKNRSLLDPIFQSIFDDLEAIYQANLELFEDIRNDSILLELIMNHQFEFSIAADLFSKYEKYIVNPDAQDQVVFAYDFINAFNEYFNLFK